LTCWEAGGDRIRLIPAFAAPKFTVMINDGFDAAVLDAWLAARGASLGGCGTGLALVASAKDGTLVVDVKRDGTPHAAATSCVRQVWGDVGPGPGQRLVISW